jgi:adhesin transport system membrane fusion protein
MAEAKKSTDQSEQLQMQLQSQAQQPRAPRAGLGPRLYLWICAVLCVVFVVWAAVMQLDIVSTAQGEVIPSTKIKSVQHLEGGIVRDIRVREGDRVEPGQPLVVLEETAQGSTVEELEVRISSLTAEAARLTAQAEGLDEPVFPEDLVEHNPDLVQKARDLFNVSRQRLQSDLSGQRENVIQRQQDIREIQTRLKYSREEMENVRKQIALSAELLEEGLTTEFKHNQLLRDETKLKGKVGEDIAALPRARSSLAESQSKLKSLDQSFREEARSKLEDVSRELEEMKQRLRKYSDTLKRTVIRSPVQGLIKTLYIVTIGGVVKPGEVIVDIVPIEDRLVIEAHLPIQDIGYVQSGQDAVVKLASRDAGRFGKLDGKVVHVSPDTFTTPEGATFYSVRIETAEDSFVRGDFEYKLIPGMLVTAYIHTGQRTVLDYLLDPFLDSMDQALKER